MNTLICTLVCNSGYRFLKRIITIFLLRTQKTNFNRININFRRIVRSTASPSRWTSSSSTCYLYFLQFMYVRTANDCAKLTWSPLSEKVTALIWWFRCTWHLRIEDFLSVGELWGMHMCASFTFIVIKKLFRSFCELQVGSYIR